VRLALIIAVAGFVDVFAMQQGDEQEIRARRESSNAAIARHDPAGIGAILLDDVVVVTSNSVHRPGRAANEESFAEQFRTRPDVVYRRTPAEVRVFAAWLMASESGTWTGSWTDPDGKIQLTGRYFAKWRKRGGQWLVESETYVPETCTGGGYCTRVP
jgi:ketosteroid isomerase-like protein